MRVFVRLVMCLIGELANMPRFILLQSQELRVETGAGFPVIESVEFT